MRRILTASFPAGRLLGVPVRIQGLFVAFFALAVGYFLAAHDTRHGLLLSLLLAGAFLFVVVHELGHALAARCFGIQVTDVTIWPLGGMARLEDVPLSGRIETAIAAAGPLANLLAAALLAGLREAARGVGLPEMRPFTLLIWINLILAIFNVLPAFPLDGGRILRCVLASFLGFARGTRAAVLIGRLLALALGAVAIHAGLYGLLLLSGFLLMNGGDEDLRDEPDPRAVAEPPIDPARRGGSFRDPAAMEQA